MLALNLPIDRSNRTRLAKVNSGPELGLQCLGGQVFAPASCRQTSDQQGLTNETYLEAQLKTSNHLDRASADVIVLNNMKLAIAPQA